MVDGGRTAAVAFRAARRCRRAPAAACARRPPSAAAVRAFLLAPPSSSMAAARAALPPAPPFDACVSIYRRAAHAARACCRCLFAWRRAPSSRSAAARRTRLSAGSIARTPPDRGADDGLPLCARGACRLPASNGVYARRRRPPSLLGACMGVPTDLYQRRPAPASLALYAWRCRAIIACLSSAAARKKRQRRCPPRQKHE